MLYITVPSREFFDEEKQEFIELKEQKLQLEHSLISLSKWESKWKKPFLDEKPHSLDETIDYIRCMTLTQNVDPIVYKTLPQSCIEKISSYIDDSMTATWFNDQGEKSSKKEIQTSEVIYYWMIKMGIPFECQKWHLNRLITLIRVCIISEGGQKKMSKEETIRSNKELNEARKKQYKTKG